MRGVNWIAVGLAFLALVGGVVGIVNNDAGWSALGVIAAVLALAQSV